jgi:hypothetical protein
VRVGDASHSREEFVARRLAVRRVEYDGGEVAGVRLGQPRQISCRRALSFLIDHLRVQVAVPS